MNNRGLVLRLCGVGLLLVALVGGGVVWDYHRFLDRPIDPDTDRHIVVEEGMGASEVVDMLVNEDLVDSPWYLRYYLWNHEAASRLQPGAYAIEAGTTVAELVEILGNGGRTDEVTVKLHAGINLWELAELLHQNGLVDRAAFLRRATDGQYAAELGVPAGSLEGYLLPGSYVLRRGSDVDAIIATFHEQFMATWVEIVHANPEAVAAVRERYALGDHELVTLASIVEREAVVDSERAVIARVFYNRFDREMKLQSDPTCVYPPQEVGEKPSPARCRDPENRYSTYVIDALPPGPIGAPSSSALRAVLTPYDGRHADEYLFFVARNDGSWTHYFSRTYEEHEQGIEHFLRKSGAKAPNQTAQPPRGR